MITFTKIDKKTYDVFRETDNEKSKLVTLNLMSHSVTNRFEIVVDAVATMCELDGFEDWYASLITSYVNSGYNSRIITNNKDEFIRYAQLYVDYMNVDFDQFVDVKKKSKTSIIFYPEDIKSIAIVTSTLKLYSFFMCDVNMKLPENIHKALYDCFIKPCADRNVIANIYNLIRSRTFRSSITDKYMWEFIGMMISETPDSYSLLVFNFFVEKILILIDVHQNPIPFLLTFIDDKIRWLMRSVYKEKTIYGEVYGGVDDQYGSTLTRENFSHLCANDIIGKAANAGMSIAESIYDVNGDGFNKFTERLDSITMIYPTAKLVILPLISKIFEVKYSQLLSIPPRHAALLGILLYEVSESTIRVSYPVLSNYLLAIPRSTKFPPQKSMYVIRNIEHIINDKNGIFGFKNKNMIFSWMSILTGILSTNKKNLMDILTGRSINKTTYYDLEADVCSFFPAFYSNKLDSVIEKLSLAVESYV